MLLTINSNANAYNTYIAPQAA